MQAGRAVADKLVLAPLLVDDGSLIALVHAFEDLAHHPTAKFHEELQEVSLGKQHVAAVGDLQPVRGPEVFFDLRYQRTHCLSLPALRILPVVVYHGLGGPFLAPKLPTSPMRTQS